MELELPKSRVVVAMLGWTNCPWLSTDADTRSGGQFDLYLWNINATAIKRGHTR
jgi:hypothetical protein